jgi:hypothetical protein
MLATVMHTLFDVGRLRLEPGALGSLQKVITDGEPIAELV